MAHLGDSLRAGYDDEHERMQKEVYAKTGSHTHAGGPP